MRRGHRQAELRRQRHHARQQRLAVRLAVALHFEVVAAGKQACPAARQLLGRLGLPADERLADVAGAGAGERDQAVGRRLLQPGAREFGTPAALIVQPGARQQAAQPEVARARGAQQEQAEGLVAVGVVLQPAVGADHGLDAGGARRAVELHHAEQVGDVGDRQRRHAVGRRALHRLVDADDAVRHRVFAMHPQVDETRPCHAKKFYSMTASGSALFEASTRPIS